MTEGIDHICCGDHVSFFGGMGFDGLVQASALTMLQAAVPVCTGSTAAAAASGAGGAPARGSRGSLAGHLRRRDRRRRPARGRGLRGGPGQPGPPDGRMPHGRPRAAEWQGGDVPRSSSSWMRRRSCLSRPTAPIIVGGRSDAAIKRRGGAAGSASGTPRAGSPPPSSRPPRRLRSPAAEPPTRHGMQVWCGFADTKQAARACLGPAMEAFYQLPFERFERYCPYGTHEDVAEFLARMSRPGAASSTSSRRPQTTSRRSGPRPR